MPLLTKQEFLMISSVSAGLSNKDISDRYHISINTVKFHLKNAYRKMKVSNRVSAAHWFREYCGKTP